MKVASEILMCLKPRSWRPIQISQTYDERRAKERVITSSLEEGKRGFTMGVCRFGRGRWFRS
jgi:hypothetical protein